MKAIIAEPDDDTPRLVYADWLEDHSQPERAEFIRLQCQLARMPANDPRRRELEEREGQLLDAHGESWRATLPEWVFLGSFRRGFLEEVCADAEGFLAEGANLLATQPVREMHLRGAGLYPAALAASPHLGQITKLDLGFTAIWDEGALALAAWPHLTKGLGGK
jgi:uncharacterized protein (TIGR02996 family)